MDICKDILIWGSYRFGVSTLCHSLQLLCKSFISKGSIRVLDIATSNQNGILFLYIYILLVKLGGARNLQKFSKLEDANKLKWVEKLDNRATCNWTQESKRKVRSYFVSYDWVPTFYEKVSLKLDLKRFQYDKNKSQNFLITFLFYT